MNYHLKLWTGVLAFAAAGVLHAAAQGQRPTMPRAGVGPADRPVVDPEAADRGRRVWVSECITCHGTQARGTDNGPNLLRSLVVLRDRYGSELGPFLKKGHQMQSGNPSTSLTDAQIVDLTHFLRQRVEDSLRGSPPFTEQNVATGDAEAGAAYFNGEGKCASCHTRPRTISPASRRGCRAGRPAAALPLSWRAAAADAARLQVRRRRRP